MEEKTYAFFEINKNKKTLVKSIAKSKGMTFKEFVNNAIDMALEKETQQRDSLLQNKELLEEELKTLNDQKTTIENKIKEINFTLDYF